MKTNEHEAGDSDHDVGKDCERTCKNQNPSLIRGGIDQLLANDEKPDSSQKLVAQPRNEQVHEWHSLKIEQFRFFNVQEKKYSDTKKSKSMDVSKRLSDPPNRKIIEADQDREIKTIGIEEIRATHPMGQANKEVFKGGIK